MLFSLFVFLVGFILGAVVNQRMGFLVAADTGFDAFGYNYTARLFNEAADGVDRATLDGIARWGIDHCPVVDALRRAVPVTTEIEPA